MTQSLDYLDLNMTDGFAIRRFPRELEPSK
jgi:hypothetical protein